VEEYLRPGDVTRWHGLVEIVIKVKVCKGRTTWPVWERGFIFRSKTEAWKFLDKRGWLKDAYGSVVRHYGILHEEILGRLVLWADVYPYRPMEKFPEVTDDHILIG